MNPLLATAAILLLVIFLRRRRAARAGGVDIPRALVKAGRSRAPNRRDRRVAVTSAHVACESGAAEAVSAFPARHDEQVGRAEREYHTAWDRAEDRLRTLQSERAGLVREAAPAPEPHGVPNVAILWLACGIAALLAPIDYLAYEQSAAFFLEDYTAGKTLAVVGVAVSTVGSALHGFGSHHAEWGGAGIQGHRQYRRVATLGAFAASAMVAMSLAVRLSATPGGEAATSTLYAAVQLVAVFVTWGAAGIAADRFHRLREVRRAARAARRLSLVDRRIDRLTAGLGALNEAWEDALRGLNERFAAAHALERHHAQDALGFTSPWVVAPALPRPDGPPGSMWDELEALRADARAWFAAIVVDGPAAVGAER